MLFGLQSIVFNALSPLIYITYCHLIVFEFVICDFLQGQRKKSLGRGPLQKGVQGVKPAKRKRWHNSLGSERRKMKLTVSNTLERASQDKDCGSSVPLERGCSVKWG